MQIPLQSGLKIREGDKKLARTAEIQRKTNETGIALQLDLDGTGMADINTGIGFFDHMLYSFARHGFFDMKLNVSGDLYVDGHHTVEDTGIVLGKAIKEALGDKKGIKRYGSSFLPMDETLVLCAIDLSGRPYFVYDVNLTADRVGYLDTELVKEFFYAVSYACGMNLHIKLIHGTNNHHIIEAIFKAFARALDEGCGYDTRISDVLSTKGTVD
jgi:imidazoleglycerol-phosphate dehydratase